MRLPTYNEENIASRSRKDVIRRIVLYRETSEACGVGSWISFNTSVMIHTYRPVSVKYFSVHNHSAVPFVLYLW
jgi:hypothetical protein